MKNQVKEFLVYLKAQGLKENTTKNYGRYLAEFLEFIGDIQPSQITAKLVLEWQNSLEERGLSNNTKSYYAIALRRFLRYLVKVGVKSLSADLVDIPKTKRKEVRCLKKEEVDRILQAANPNKKTELRDRVILELFASTGIRLSELIKIKVEDLDFTRRELVLPECKGGKSRVVFFTKEVKDFLELYLKKRKLDSPFLFPSSYKDGPLGPRPIQRLVKKYADRAGVKNVHPHLLRHSFASRILSRGANLRQVQDLLGHQNVNTTQIYTHITKPELRKAYDQANSSFATAPDGTPQKNEFLVMSRESYYKLVGKMSKLLQEQLKIRKDIEKIKDKLDSRGRPTSPPSKTSPGASGEVS